MFQLGPYKASGLDGYQTYWEIVKEGICKTMENFFNSGRMLKEINATNIVIIPKVKTLEMVNQFRPISLYNYAYKVITTCHNGFSLDLDDHKNNGVAIDLFCISVIGHSVGMILNQGPKTLI